MYERIYAPKVGSGLSYRRGGEGRRSVGKRWRKFAQRQTSGKGIFQAADDEGLGREASGKRVLYTDDISRGVRYF